MPTPIASATGTIDANGSAIVRIGPDRYGVTWHVTRYVTTMGGTQVTPTLRLYQNTIGDGTQIDSTRLPASDASDADLQLVSPDVLIGVYAGGTPGTTATLIVWGDITRGRPR